MIARIRLIITALVVCHLLLQPRLINQPVACLATAGKSGTIDDLLAAAAAAKFGSIDGFAAGVGQPRLLRADDDDDLDDLLDDISPAAAFAKIRHHGANR